jgi:dihydrofolate reductase
VRSSAAVISFLAWGVELYVMALPFCERIYLAEVHAELSGDTWFPDYETGESRKRDRIDHLHDPANRYP